MKRKLTELKHKKKLLAATFLGSSRQILYVSRKREKTAGKRGGIIG